MPSDTIQSDEFSEYQIFSDLLLSPVKLDHIAKMVAQGELPFPENIEPEQMNQLALEVRKQRRRRLIRYIARSIAMDIYLENGL